MTPAEFEAAIEKLGMDAKAAAPFLGLSLRFVYRIKTGHYPCPESAVKLLRLMVKKRISVSKVEAMK